VLLAVPLVLVLVRLVLVLVRQKLGQVLLLLRG
jgi:hypothetical protein